MNPLDTCPCTNAKPYKECCFPLHNRVKNAITAEELMRSRYSAYVLKDEEYLKRTWHRSKRPKELNLKKENIEWLGLEIINKENGGRGDREGIVEFLARYKIQEKEYNLHEKSNFIKKDKRWFYLDGEIM